MSYKRIKELIQVGWLFFIFLSLGTNVYQDLFGILKRPPEQIDLVVLWQLSLLCLPLFVGCGAVFLFWKEWRYQFKVGHSFIFWPLFCLTILIGISLFRIDSIFLPQVILMVVVFWLVYLFILNETLPLRKLLLFILVVQGSIGIMQFVLKHDLGLQWLGEPQLGEDILHVGDIPYGREYWLRSTGLSHNANRYGMTLILLFGSLLSLPRHKKDGWWVMGVVGGMSFAAVLASVSRSGLLGIGAGLFIFGVSSWGERKEWMNWFSWRSGAAVLFIFGVLIYLFRDVLMLRFLYYSAGYWEIETLGWRHQANLMAVGLMLRFPWFGVGVGQYGWFSYQVNPGGILVHNVPLWVGAELGFPGFIIWHFLLWIPLISKQCRPIDKGVWGAMILISLLNPGPGILTGLHGGILFAVICGIMGKDRTD